MNNNVKFSVLIPIFNEEKCIKDTIQKCHAVMNGSGFAYEIITINDGSSDKSGEVLYCLFGKCLQPWLWRFA